MTTIDFNVEKNDEDPKFKVGDHVRKSKYKNIFEQNVTLQIGLKKFLRLSLLFRGHVILRKSFAKNKSKSV